MDVSYHRKRIADFAAGMRAAKGLAARERMPRDELHVHRRARLNALARHAALNSPFWADRLAGAMRHGDVDLSEVPPLSKSALMEHWDDAVTDRRLKRDDLLEYLEGLDGDSLYMGEYRVMTTSGSSGLKGLFAYDRAAWRALLGQFFRYNEMIGIKPRLPRRFRIAAIGGAKPTHMTQRIAATVKVGVHRVLPLPVTMPLPELVNRLNEFQPDFINAYPSVACLLADEQEAGRLNLSLSIMSTSSELRTAEMSERIERAFGVKPFDMFGSTEGLWGSECHEHAGIHLFDDMCIVENVGDRLLVTNLFNSAQPLIRFEITDVMTFAGEPCPCGRTLTRVASVEGRTDDVLQLPSGNGAPVPVHPLQFGVVTADRDVREFQVVESGGRLTLRLVLRDGADPAAAEQRVRAHVCERLTAIGVDSPQVEVELNQALERSPAGKLPVVVAKR